MRQGLNKHGTSGYHYATGLERRPQVKIVRPFSQLHVLASITRIKCASLADTKVFENGCTRGRPMRIPSTAVSAFVEVHAFPPLAMWGCSSLLWWLASGRGPRPCVFARSQQLMRGDRAPKCHAGNAHSAESARRGGGRTGLNRNGGYEPRSVRHVDGVMHFALELVFNRHGLLRAGGRVQKHASMRSKVASSRTPDPQTISSSNNSASRNAGNVPRNPKTPPPVSR